MPALAVPAALLAHAAHVPAAGGPDVAHLVLAALPFLAATVLLRSRNGALSIVVLFSAAAGFVHAVVTPVHVQEDLAVGLFTLAVTMAQMAVVVLALNRPSRGLWLATAVGNAAVLLIWAWSRTTGLPFGPTPGAPEPMGFLDLACAAYEVAMIAGSVTLARRRGLLAPSFRANAPIAPTGVLATL